MTEQPIVAWTELPVADLTKSAEFYAKVFGWTMQITQMGPNDVVVFNGADTAAGGHLYPSGQRTSGGPTVHLSLPDALEPASERLEKAGGTLVGPVVEIPAGRFQYALDLDGNSIGLFEPGKG